MGASKVKTVRVSKYSYLLLPYILIMKNTIVLLLSLTSALFTFGQNAEALYRKADSLYTLKEFTHAAVAYSDAIKIGNNTPVRIYRAGAASWAMASKPDSAFKLLSIITTSGKTTNFDVYQIENGVHYSGLHTDKRWKPLIEALRKQGEKNSFRQEECIYGRKDGIALTLVWIKPKVPSNGKAIIVVVSGGWVSGYNGIEISSSSAEKFLSKGYEVFAVVHGSQPRYAIPDAVNDIKRAVRYIRYNASRFGIDPNKIGITGGSAGGHLSLVVATPDDEPNPAANDPVDRVSSRVQAVAVLYPPTDFLNWGGRGMNLINAKEILKMNRSWGAADFRVWNERFRLYEEVTDTAARNKIAKEISPLYFVSADDPPVFIIHGDADPTVPLQQSQAIVTRLNETGIPHRFVIKKGGKHNPDHMNPEWEEFADWFDKYLK